MALSTYADLQSTVASYLARDDLTSMIPTFIAMAELRLNRDLRIRQMLNVATTTTTSGDPTVQLPSDFGIIRDIHLNTNPIATLQYNSPSAFYRNDKPSTIGQPKFYTILANELQLAPVPDGEYELQMLYYVDVPALSNTNTTNVFMTTCPDLLLYAALGEAEPYLMNDVRLQTWATLYQKGLDSLTIQDDAGEFSGTPLSITVANR